MPKYKYIVVTEENQQLSGIIGAPDEKSARKELNQLGFSIVSMEETTAEEKPSAAAAGELAVFEFGAIDKNQKKIAGTIQAEDRYAAFKRLVAEYNFEVEYVIDNALSEEQKGAERAKGAHDLAQKFDEETVLTKKKETGEEKDLKEFEKKQEILNEQIEFVLRKVQTMLDTYEEEMIPETKGKIHGFVDKILRIRRSTNLEYIRKAAEELLLFLQKEELFLHEESRKKERTKMALEAKSMMMQLRQKQPRADLDVATNIRKWRATHITNNPDPSSLDKVLNTFAGLLIGFHPETAEVTEIKKEIKLVEGQLKQYIQLYFQSPSPEFKAEAKVGLKKLWNQRKKLKNQLGEMKGKIDAEMKQAEEESGREKFINDILAFSSWLLAFYLIYYFISIYAVTKDLGIPDIPYLFYIYNSSFLKYFLATLFLLYASLSIKVLFFKRNEVATLVITPVFLFATIMIYLNF